MPPSYRAGAATKRRGGRFTPVTMRTPCLFILATLLTVPTPAREKKDPTADFFGPTAFHTIHIHVSNAQWDLMQPTRRAKHMSIDAALVPDPTTRPARPAVAFVDPLPSPNVEHVDGEKMPPNNFGFEFVYVKAQVEIDNERISDVGLRFKGNASYDQLQNTPRRPFKLDFNRYVKGRKFLGMGALNLGNNAFDATQLREALSYEVYRRAGVPTPRTALVNVYITVDGKTDHQFLGLYTAIEEEDDDAFLRRAFGNNKGIMLKPEGLRGWPYLSERWEPYAERYRAKTDATPDLARRFIEFTKFINYSDDATFEKRLDEFLAVDNYLRYLAATVLITNLDSPLATNHNYYLYLNPADQRVWILPWDMNLSFGSYGTQGQSAIHTLSIAQPWSGENRFLQRLLAIDKHRAAYHAYLKQFIDQFFNEKTMHPLITAMIDAAVLEADAAEDATLYRKPTVNSGPWFATSRLPLDSYVTQRVKSVQAQLAGDMTGVFVPRGGSGGGIHRWGLRADYNLGSLPAMARAIRESWDSDGDFRFSPREIHDAVAALYYQLADEDKPDQVTQAQVASALEPLLAPYVSASRSSRGRTPTPAPAAAWARLLFQRGDTAGDAALTLPELTALADRYFCLADRDHDSFLDEREVIEALDLLLATDNGY